MGLIDFAKQRVRGLQDWSTPQRVVFHHVPKCGGTSVGRALRKRYILSQATVKPEESFRAFEIYTGRTDRVDMLRDVVALRTQMMLYLMAEDVRCVSLHVPYTPLARAAFGDQYKFITILRDPVARFISHYRWSYARDGAHARIEEPLDAFLETPRARRLGASYANYFAGLPVGEDITTPAAVEAAIANLKAFDVVGEIEDLGGFGDQIKEQLGVRLRVGHENRAGAARKAHDIDITADQRAQITTLCAPDIAIWQAVTGRT